MCESGQYASLGRMVRKMGHAGKKKPKLMEYSLGWGKHVLMGAGILAGAFPNQQTDGGCVQAKGFAQVVF